MRFVLICHYVCVGRARPCYSCHKDPHDPRPCWSCRKGSHDSYWLRPGHCSPQWIYYDCSTLKSLWVSSDKPLTPSVASQSISSTLESSADLLSTAALPSENVLDQMCVTAVTVVRIKAPRHSAQPGLRFRSPVALSASPSCRISFALVSIGTLSISICGSMCGSRGV